MENEEAFHSFWQRHILARCVCYVLCLLREHVLCRTHFICKRIQAMHLKGISSISVCYHFSFASIFFSLISFVWFWKLWRWYENFQLFFRCKNALFVFLFVFSIECAPFYAVHFRCNALHWNRSVCMCICIHCCFKIGVLKEHPIFAWVIVCVIDFELIEFMENAHNCCVCVFFFLPISFS